MIRIQDSKHSHDQIRQEFDKCLRVVQEMEIVMYKKQTDMPNIFDDIQNKIVDLVSCNIDVS
jgi:hypothetical protein